MYTQTSFSSFLGAMQTDLYKMLLFFSYNSLSYQEHTFRKTLPFIHNTHTSTTVLLYQESEVVFPQFNLQAVVSYSSLVECVDKHWILLGCPEV